VGEACAGADEQLDDRSVDFVADVRSAIRRDDVLEVSVLRTSSVCKYPPAAKDVQQVQTIYPAVSTSDAEQDRDRYDETHRYGAKSIITPYCDGATVSVRHSRMPRQCLCHNGFTSWHGACSKALSLSL
jgi:hypothetical protein